MVAILALTLFVIGAVAVDMGQVYAKRSALQSNVDHAVLAAAAELDNGGSCNSEVTTVAAEYLLKAANEVHGQHPVDLTGAPGDTDGFIRCSDWKVELWAPKSWAEFGMGKAAGGSTGVDVPAFAAAQIKSPGTSNDLPMYGVDGCDSGSQVIADPPPGHSTPPIVPPLTPDSPTHNTATFTLSPYEVASGTASATLTLTGTDLTDVTKVAFTMAGGPPDHHLSTSVTVDSPGTQISAPVPGDVLARDGVWWVRVVKDDGSGGDQYSENATAEALLVGEVLFCGGMVSGNFGTLKVARDDSPAGKWVEFNTTRGLQPTTTMHPTMTSGDCDGAAGSVQSDHTPVDGTNCIWTDPGLPGPELWDALVTGFSGQKGRLDEDTTPGCDRTGGDSRTPTSHPINDDLLTCFIVDDSKRIQDLVDGTEDLLSGDIFDSPRFFQIPVIPADAAHGASQHYPIINKIPGFITSEPLSATPTTPGAVTEWNGLEVHANKVEELHVVLFHPDALPGTAPATGGEIDYLGYGTKVIVLVE